jgi:hypothetical protein
LSLVAPLAFVRELSPGDPLFIGVFVAALCFAIAGFLTVAAPAALPGFVAGLVNAFLLFGAVFLALGVAGALVVALWF